MNIYKQASKLNLTFPSRLGALSVPQLHSLPLTSQTKLNLNDIAIAVSHNIKEVIDFVGTSTKDNNAIEVLRLDILKDIIADKKQEIRAKAEAAKRRQEIEKLEGVLERKEYKDTESLSKKAILAKIEALKSIIH